MSDINSLFTIESMATLAGASGMTYIVSSTIQQVFNYNPKWLALLIAITISVLIVINGGGESIDYVMAIINGCLIYTTTIGGNTIISRVSEGAEIDRNSQDYRNNKKPMKFFSSWF